jgi:hypothetical protein
MQFRKWPLNRAGLPIIEAVRPSEQFCLVFDCLTDNYKGVKFRQATVPSRLKYTD